MTANALKDALHAIIADADWTPEGFSNGCLQLRVTKMYEGPGLGADELMKLCELFGTKQINVDGYNVSGCESCDYGSAYGHTLEITGATKNVSEFSDWTRHPRR